MLGKAEIAAIVPVSDVEKAVEFYGGTLGLELQIRRDDLPENREAEFRAGDGSLSFTRASPRPEQGHCGRLSASTISTRSSPAFASAASPSRSTTSPT